MTDLLVSQAEIKARHRPIRDASGQFIRPSRALEIKLAAERMKASLKRDVEALEHAAGYAWVHAHPRPLPHAGKPLSVVPADDRQLPLPVAA